MWWETRVNRCECDGEQWAKRLSWERPHELRSGQEAAVGHAEDVAGESGDEELSLCVPGSEGWALWPEGAGEASQYTGKREFYTRPGAIHGTILSKEERNFLEHHCDVRIRSGQNEGFLTNGCCADPEQPCWQLQGFCAAVIVSIAPPGRPQAAHRELGCRTCCWGSHRAYRRTPGSTAAVQIKTKPGPHWLCGCLSGWASSPVSGLGSRRTGFSLNPPHFGHKNHTRFPFLFCFKGLLLLQKEPGASKL